MTDEATFSWGHAALRVDFHVDTQRRVRIVGVGPDGPVDPSDGLPLVEVLVAGHGRWAAAERATGTVFGERLAYQRHEESREGGWLCLRVDLADPDTGLTAQVHLRTPDGVSAVQSWVRLANRGEQSLVVESVTSMILGGIADGDGGVAGLDVWHADNEWLAEGRWQRRALREVLVDMNFGRHRQEARSSFSRTSQGTWSTGRHLPMGALTARDSGRTLMWQVESPGGWRWEVGEYTGIAYVALLGPTDRDHQWHQGLHPGGEFTTVPAAVAIGASGDGGDGFAEATAAMTAYRRALRRPHPDHADLPVIFNDYMNTVMGDPTTERLRPLIDAAAEAGAEYFVIDAGWYAGWEGWWNTVGEWEESAVRFPGGLIEVVDRIRARDMVPGLWLEPEVVGVRSPLAETLPDAAFFQRAGERVVDNGRYHLDLRHPAAVGHLDAVVDRLVADYGVGYLKLDYNVNPGPGTDLPTGDPGAGLLGHERALLAWLDGVLDRHPGLTLENCASGAMRSDYAMLSRLQLQSTSDQQEHYRYPSIAAAAPAAIAPEQAANWAYPQPDFSDAENAFALCNALLGRFYLSGHLDRMTPEQHAQVADAVAVYKRIRTDIAASVPLWPLGLPGWTDPWIALGLRGAATTYVTVWRRPGEESAAGQTLLIPHLKGRDVDVSVLFPQDPKCSIGWIPGTGELTVQLPEPGTACLIAIG
ncbi:alpha-galactosidase [Catenulispora pinisilvae]|uniref:alpha-galactosidase n=1 Tax=Catenulispora pinisilvae TaxID=2705253 RepID=UPI0018923057|nr:alpha-galactosidase [Catenulispora pinisilvae]